MWEQRLNKEHLLCSFCFRCCSHKCGWMGKENYTHCLAGANVQKCFTQCQKGKVSAGITGLLPTDFCAALSKCNISNMGKIPTNVQLNTSQIQKDGPDVLQRWTNIWPGQHPACTLCSKALAIRLRKTPTDSCKSKTPIDVNWWKMH